MKKLWLTGLAALSLSLSPQSASAQDSYGCCETVSGFYVGAYAGGNWFADSELSWEGGSRLFHNYETDSGYILGGYAGYRFCNNLRLEVDIGWRDNDVDIINVYNGSTETQPQVTASEITAVSYMGNIIYDCVLDLCDCCVRPYFGVGFGAASVKVEGHYSGFDVDDNETVFAYQLIIGLAYPWCQTMDIAVEYRYFGADELSLNTNNAAYLARDYINSHSVGVSGKYYFGCCGI